MSTRQGKVAAGDVAARSSEVKMSRPRDSKKTEEDLEAAFLKLKNQGKTITARAIADAVGVDPSLIPKAYGRIHQLILKAKGKAPAQKLDAKENELKELRRVLSETRQAKEEGDQQVTDLVSINATLEERLKEQAKVLADAADAAQVRAITEERDALAAENQELKVWVAELQAQLQGKLVGRIGQHKSRSET